MSSPFKTRKKTLLGKIQSGDTPETLVADDGKLLIKTDFTHATNNVTNDRSDVSSGSLSNRPTIMGSKAETISGTFELIGSGDASVKGRYDTMFRACRMTPYAASSYPVSATSAAIAMMTPITGATSGATGYVVRQADTGATSLTLIATSGTFEPTGEDLEDSDSTVIATTTGAPTAVGFAYKLGSSNLEKGTFSLWTDDHQVSIYSAMGSMNFQFEVSAICQVAVEIMGKITRTGSEVVGDQWGDGTRPSICYDDVNPPVLHSANMFVTDSNGQNKVSTLVGSVVNINQANTMSLIRDMNDPTGIKTTEINSQGANIELTILKPTEAQWDYYEKLYNDQLVSVEFVYGSQAGNTFVIGATFSVSDVSLGDENGNSTVTISGALSPNSACSGDTEFSILAL